MDTSFTLSQSIFRFVKLVIILFRLITEWVAERRKVTDIIPIAYKH